MRDGLIIHDDADKTPPLPPGRHPLTPISYADEPRRSWRLPAQAWVIVTAAVLVPVLGLLVALWRGFDSLFLRWPWLADATLVGLLAVFLVVIAGVAHGIYGWARAKAMHARVVRTRWGNPADVQQVLDMNPLTLETLHAQVEVAHAPYRQFPNLSTMTGSRAPEKSTEQAMLPAPENVIGLISDREWFGWIDQTPHLMIAGRTNAGKTTLATAILNERVRSGELVCFLDPHDQPGKWFGGQAIGGGRNYTAILDALGGLLIELDARYKEYNQGKESDEFERLTVLIDEVPAIVLNDDNRWLNFANKLGSEARKVRISVVLLTQSHLVKSIKIDSVMRENFIRVALGDQASGLLSEEKQPKRRLALTDLLRGQAHPATMEHNGEVHVLDTSAIPSIASRRTPAPRLWIPVAPEQSPRQAAAAAARERLEQARKIATVGSDDVRKAIAAELAQAGYSTRAIQWASRLRNDLVCEIWRQHAPQARQAA